MDRWGQLTGSRRWGSQEGKHTQPHTTCRAAAAGLDIWAPEWLLMIVGEIKIKEYCMNTFYVFYNGPAGQLTGSQIQSHPTCTEAVASLDWWTLVHNGILPLRRLRRKQLDNRYTYIFPSLNSQSQLKLYGMTKNISQKTLSSFNKVISISWKTEIPCMQGVVQRWTYEQELLFPHRASLCLEKCCWRQPCLVQQ